MIGSPIPAELLDDVAQPTVEAIDECLASGMLLALGDGAFAFRHELAREAIYEAISPLRRRDWHAGVLAALRVCRSPLRTSPGSRTTPRRRHDKEAVLRFAPAAARRAATCTPTVRQPPNSPGRSGLLRTARRSNAPSCSKPRL